MKKILLLTLLIGIFTGCDFHKSVSNNPAEIEKILQTARKKYAPDSRDHVWEIQIKFKEDTLILSGYTDRPEALAYVKKQLPENLTIRYSVQILPAPAFQNKVGVIRLSVANLRTQPTHSAELASQMLMGMPIQILQFKNGFYRIRTTEGYLGWTEPASIEIMDRKQFREWLAKPKVIVMSPYVKITVKENPASRQISDAVMNNVMALTGQNDFFSQVELPDGKTGFVPNDAVMILEEWQNLSGKLFHIQDLLQTVQKDFMGIPYLWGGTSIKAMDCSGFTKNLFQNFNILLPRDASQQYKTGKEITLNDSLSYLQPGDLLFFGKIRPGGVKKITHVALYAGNGRIYHATGEVKEESLFPDDSLYNEARRKTLLGAKRIWGYYNREVYPYYTEKAFKIFFPD